MADPYVSEVASYALPLASVPPVGVLAPPPEAGPAFTAAGPAMSVAPAMSMPPPPQAPPPGPVQGPPPPPPIATGPEPAMDPAMAGALRTSSLPVTRTPETTPTPAAPTPMFSSQVVSSPAREIDMRAPSLKAAQDTLSKNYVQRVAEGLGRRERAANDEAQMYERHVQDARMRAAAADQSAAERAEELQQRQADFDSSVKALSKMSLDPNRFWASRNTGEKIAGIVSIALGGFLQGARGGSNPGLDIINTAIERDIKAQEFAYSATRDTAQMKQTAFAMAMQKYNNVDAARAAARASMQDAVQAEVSRQGSTWKTVDAQAHADELLTKLDELKVSQIQNGVKFMPASSSRVFYDKDLPGVPLTQAQFMARFEKKEERQHALNVEGVKGEYALDRERMEQVGKLATQSGQAANRQVVLPNGDRVTARSDKETEKIADISKAVSNAQQLVATAKDIRNKLYITGEGSFAMNPLERLRLERRLDAIEAQLTTSFKDEKGLGALSGPDMELANKAVGALKVMGPNAQLDEFEKWTNKGLQNYVKTLPGTPETAQGKLPAEADFRPTGTGR